MILTVKRRYCYIILHKATQRAMMNQLSNALQNILGPWADVEDQNDVNASGLYSKHSLHSNTSSIIFESSNATAHAEGDWEQWPSLLSGTGSRRA